MMNPPYSMGSKNNTSLYEINFTEHLLNSITQDGKVIVIVPQSSMTGKTKEEQAIKENILKRHTLEGVITLSKNTFYGVGTNPCIAIFTTGVPHDKDKEVKFINFEKDGFEVQKHRGLVETIEAKDKKQHLLDVWFDRIESETKFCVKTTIEAEDEWLHSFYYFNDEIPTEADFEKTIGDFLTFEFSMIVQGRGYLFDNEKKTALLKQYEKQVSEFESVVPLSEKEWKEFKITYIFNDIQRGKRLKKDDHKSGIMPYISSTRMNNGVDGFVDNKENVRIFSNCLTLANSGSVGATFYQPFSFVASDHVTKLENSNFNKYIYLFIANMLKRLSEKYCFNREIKDPRIKKEKIMLPINSKSEPDYAYMENYLKTLENDKIKQYLEYKKQDTNG